MLLRRFIPCCYLQLYKILKNCSLIYILFRWLKNQQHDCYFQNWSVTGLLEEITYQTCSSRYFLESKSAGFNQIIKRKHSLFKITFQYNYPIAETLFQFSKSLIHSGVDLQIFQMWKTAFKKFTQSTLEYFVSNRPLNNVFNIILRSCLKFQIYATNQINF